jgi:predicted 3-demethylubiquinone-9 3-methyltransferase (glyoxalase superfamily)
MSDETKSSQPNSIYSCFWCEKDGADMAAFYIKVFGEIFPNSKLLHSDPMVTMFELNGTKFMALNGGENPAMKYAPGTSHVVECETQAQIDHLWQALGVDGGKPSHCGWLDDRFGVTWQIVPKCLGELMGNPETAPLVGKVLGESTKFVIADLKAAADGKKRKTDDNNDNDDKEEKK